MTHGPLIRKCLREARLLLMFSALAMFGFCWLRVWIVSLLPTDSFKTILEQFRHFERFSPVPFEQLFTYPGRMALTYDELIVVMCVVVWSIARGSDCVAGELGRGTMELMIAQPVSRLRILTTQASVTLGGVAVLTLSSWLGLWVGIHTTTIDEPASPMTVTFPTFGTGGNPVDQLFEGDTRPVPMSSKVSANDMWPATVNLFALGFFLAGLSSLVSAPDRYRWRTIGIVAGFYVFQLILKIIGLASDQFSWLLKFTFFTAYEPEKFVSIAVHTPEQAWRLALHDGQAQWVGYGPLFYDLLLIGMGLVAYMAAAVIFARRDLPAPV